MYGLVNSVFKESIVEKYGQQIWSLIKGDSLPDDFDHFGHYDDQITEDIVVKLNEITAKEPEVLLEEFGQYWIGYAKNSEYKRILEVYSTSSIHLIKSLDALHTRLAMAFENLDPPSFWTSELKDNYVLVHYQSKRTLPLEYFVVGLIKGIFDNFDQKCGVLISQFRDGDKEAIFKVSF
jgi:hypothetical protein